MARDKERILDAYLVASARLGDREALGSPRPALERQACSRTPGGC